VLTERRGLLHQALALAWFTVAWNVTEAIVAITGALAADSRALLGFGLDSVVESLSAAVLIWRLRVEQQEPDRAERVEQRAVKLIGMTFFVLAAVVAFEAVRSLLTKAEPDSSALGIVLTAVSLLVMPALAARKRRLGVAMGSQAVKADSAQTSVCAYLSGVVLAGLVLNALVGWWWADPIAALVVVGLLAREGWDALHAEHMDECC
jgi:cation diffusion facilitator family transporter